MQRHSGLGHASPAAMQRGWRCWRSNTVKYLSCMNLALVGFTSISSRGIPALDRTKRSGCAAPTVSMHLESWLTTCMVTGKLALLTHSRKAVVAGQGVSQH